jgi:alkylation response protein AidB-like acyl-CoA dehydrogenase
MLIEPSAEESAILDAFQRFLDRKVTPLAQSLGEAPPTKTQTHELLRGLAEFGVGALNTPTEFGGQGANNVLTARLIEALLLAFKMARQVRSPGWPHLRCARNICRAF